MLTSKKLGINPENKKEIFLNSGRFGPYLNVKINQPGLKMLKKFFQLD